MSFFENNTGLWGFLALLVACIFEVLRRRRTAGQLGHAQWATLVDAVSRLVDGELNQVVASQSERLTVGQELPVRVQTAAGQLLTPAPQALYELMSSGKVIRVIGATGSGKSVLGLLVARYAVDRARSVEGSPLVHVIDASLWRDPGLLRRGWSRWIHSTDSFEDWMAHQCSRHYRQFGRHMRKLLSDRRLMLCLDGLDEVPVPERTSLERALRIHMSTRPGYSLLVLSRSSIDDRATAVRLEGAESYELLPLERETVRPLLEDGGLDEIVRNARQPYAVRALLANPLYLAIVVQARPPGSSTKTLLESERPREDLLRHYLDDVLASAAVRAGDPQSTERVAQLMALASRGTRTVRVRDLLRHPLAARVTTAIWALVLLSWGWLIGSISLALVLTTAIAHGVRPLDWGVLNRLRRRRFYNRPFGSITFLALVYGALWQVLHTTVITTKAAFDSAYGVLAAPSFDVWWRTIGEPNVTGSVRMINAIPAISIGVCCASLSMMELETMDARSDVRSALRALGGGRVADSVVARCCVTAGVVGLASIYPSVTLLSLGRHRVAVSLEGLSVATAVVLLTPVVFEAVSAALVIRRERLRPRAVRVCIKALVSTGLLAKTDPGYRFAHGSFAEFLATKALASMTEPEALRRLAPDEVIDLIDSRRRAEVTRWVKPMLANMARLYPHDESVAFTQGLFLYRVQDDLGSAERTLRTMLTASPTSPGRVLLAEILTVSGRKPEADREWAVATQTQPSDFEPVQYAVRRDLRAGRVECAEKRLQRAADRFGMGVFRSGADQAICNVHFLELQSQFADDVLSRSARLELGRLVAAVDPQVRVRAVLELARVAIETEPDLARAKTLLQQEVLRGSNHALLLARLAVAEWLSFRDQDAVALARTAWDSLRWDNDPVEELETCVLVGVTCHSHEALAEAAAMRLVRRGWRLRGRSGGTYLARASVQRPLVEAAFEGQVSSYDSALAELGTAQREVRTRSGGAPQKLPMAQQTGPNSTSR